jgi:arylsulfatase A-like enzyme
MADVLATFADIAGVSLASVPGVQTNGVSVAPLFKDAPNAIPERTLYWEFGLQLGDANSLDVAPPYQAARKGQWKAVRYYHTKPIELYDVMADPGETKDVSATQPELMKEFQALFEKHKARDS